MLSNSVIVCYVSVAFRFIDHDLFGENILTAYFTLQTHIYLNFIREVLHENYHFTSLWALL